MKKHIPAILFLFISLCSHHAGAQSLTIGTGVFQSSNVFGPANTSITAGSESRYAYIYPASLLKGLKHGDTITAIEFYRNSGGVMTGTANLKIYMRTTLNNNYGPRNINWANSIGATGMKKVYDKNPATDIGSATGFCLFTLSTPCVYDTLLGKNLEILTEYTQTSSQSQDIFWSYDNAATVPAYTTNQTKYFRGTGTFPDTTLNTNERHPYIRLNFPQYDNDAAINKVYSLGKIPIPLGNPDTLKALLKNVGKKTLTNLKIYAISKGQNKLIDSTVIALINPLQEKLIVLPALNPTKTGLDTIEIRVATDNNSANNSNMSFRVATENIYSYRDVSLPPDPGGIGFNGSTGDFVAKFYSNTPKAINQITVNFGFTGNNFKLGIWKADGVNGLPKTNIWTSDTLKSKLTFITPVYPPVSVSGSFYVGVRQINTGNVAFGYQTEDPVRPGTFFYAAPYGDTNWIDFAPDAPFKFLIEPRLQANNDVSPLSYDFPTDTINFFTMKTMAPKATIFNYGTNDQTTPFNITCNIRQFNSLVYTSTKTDTIYSYRKHKIVFDSSFLPTGPGDYTVEIVTSLPGDQVKDNDTLKTNIFVARYKDAGTNSVFEPSNGFSYELGIDTVFPVFRVNNYGVDQLSPFLVRANIYDTSKNVVYTDLKLTPTLSGINSALMNLKAFPCSKTGKYIFEVYTALNGDKDRKNDTSRSVFYIIKSNDVGVTAVTVPVPNSTLTPGGSPVNPKVTIENLGEDNQNVPFTVVCNIFRGATKVYSDSLKTTCFVTIPVIASFPKAFNPAVKGYYNVVTYTRLGSDQFHKNDTFKSVFAVGVPDDVTPVKLLWPADTSTLEVRKVYSPKVTVRNLGFLPQNVPFNVHFEVRQAGVPVYLSTKSMTLDSGLSKTITFDSTFKPLLLANHDVLVYTSLAADYVRNNDTLRGLYHVIKSHDVEVTGITFPDSVDMNIQPVFPSATIYNLGRAAETTAFPITCIITNLQGTIVYSSTTDSTLDFAAGKTIVFNTPFTGTATGTHRIRIFTKLSTDQLNSNDTMSRNFEVVTRNDVSPLVMVYPANSATIKNNIGLLAPKGRVYNWGIDNQPDVAVTIRIRNSSLVTVYTDSVHTRLNSQQTKTVVFDSSFNPSVPGNYIVTLLSKIANDQKPQNDSIVTAFVISDNSDITAVLSDNTILLYPNPASEMLTITSLDKQAMIVSVTICDATGKQQLAQRNVNDSRTTCAISSLANGLYIVEVILNNGQTSRQRVNIMR